MAWKPCGGLVEKDFTSLGYTVVVLEPSKRYPEQWEVSTPKMKQIVRIKWDGQQYWVWSKLCKNHGPINGNGWLEGWLAWYFVDEQN